MSKLKTFLSVIEKIEGSLSKHEELGLRKTASHNKVGVKQEGLSQPKEF